MLVNPFKEVGHVAEEACEEVGKVLGIVNKTERVLVTVVTHEGAFKKILVSEVKEMVNLAAKVDSCVIEKGLNLADDEDLLVDIKAFFADVKANLIPEVNKVYGEIISDTANTPSVPTSQG